MPSRSPISRFESPRTRTSRTSSSRWVSPPATSGWCCCTRWPETPAPRAASRPGDAWSAPPRRSALGLVAATELRHLGPSLVPGFLHDRRHLGVRGEALPAFPVPVEDHPDPVVLVGVSEDGRALGTVLLPLLCA